MENYGISKIHLDKRNKKQDGIYPLKLTVTHKKPFHISLDISIPEENWVGGKIEGDVTNKTFLNNYIIAQYKRVENLLLLLKLNGKLGTTTPEKLRKMIISGTDNFEEENTGSLGKELLFKEYTDNFLITLRQYYKGGRFDFLLNSDKNIDLLSKRFIVFEIDAIKENRELFPVVTITIMEDFINKMRRFKRCTQAIDCGRGLENHCL